MNRQFVDLRGRLLIAWREWAYLKRSLKGIQDRLSELACPSRRCGEQSKIRSFKPILSSVTQKLQYSLMVAEIASK